MTDIFAAEGISVEKPSQGTDIFSAEGITPPSITERNSAAINDGVSLSNPIGEDQKFVADETIKAQSDIEVLAKTRFSQEQIDAFRNNPITWTEAGKFLNAQNVLPGGGIYQGIDLAIANSAVKKLEKGEQISVTEEETLNGLIDTYLEQELRGFSIGGGIRYGLSQMPAFVIEFIASGGVGKLAQVSAQKGVEKAATALAVKSAAKMTAAKAIGVAANVTARTVAMPSLYIPKYAERRLNDSMAITDKGELIAQESQESPAKAAAMSFSYSLAEVASEMSGTAVGKYVLDPVRGALKTPLIAAVNNLPAPVKNAMYKAYKAINPNAQVSKVFTAAGWNGMIEELGEERVNQVFQSVIAAVGQDQQMAADGKNFTTEDFLRMVTPTPDQLAVEAGIIAIAGGVKTSSDIAFNLLKNRGLPPAEAREIVENMSAIETENLVESLVQKPQSEYVAPQTPDMPQTKQEAVVRYADGASISAVITEDKFIEDIVNSDAIKKARLDRLEEEKSFIRGRDWTVSNSEQESISSQVIDELGERAFDEDGDVTQEYLDLYNERLAEAREREVERLSAEEVSEIYDIDDALKIAPSIVADKIQQLLDDVGLKYTRVKSRIGDSHYFEVKAKIFNEEGDVKDTVKIRVSDHFREGGWQTPEQNLEVGEIITVHSAPDFNIQPNGEDIQKLLDFISENSNVRYQDVIALQESPEIRLYDGAQKQIEKTDPPPINNEESMSDQFIREMRNDLWPIHRLGEMAREQGLDVEGFKTKKFNPAELTTRMYSSVLTQANWMINHAPFYYDKSGNAVNMGKGLKPILDDFDNYFIPKEPSMKERRKDFTDYLIARRYLQDLTQREDVMVTAEQKQKSATDMARLQAKYGEDMAFFDTFAQELYDYQKAVLYRLVVSGNMTQEKYDQIVKQNPNYIPFQRVIDKETVNSITQNNPLFDNANARKVIKAIHGSEAEVKDPIQSIILNTHKITDLALRNDVARQVYNYKDIMPEYVQEVPPNMVKAGTAKIKVTYDKRLREKLTQAIDYFGNKFEQKKTLNERGRRGFVRGDYSPQERLVRLCLGSSDAVLAHEVGHMLDFELGLGKRMLADKAIKEELLKLAEQRLSADTNLKDIEGQKVFEDVRREVESADYVSYVKNNYEIIANLYDAYVNTPDLLNSIAPNAKKMFEDIVRQRPDAAFVLDIKPSLERAEENVEQEVWMPSPIPPAGTITAFVDGEKKYVLASKPIYEAMKNLSPAQLNLFERIFILPITTMFRMGATLTPEFMIRSIPREGLTAILLNRDVKFSLKNYARGFFAVIQDAVGSRNDLYKEFSRSARFSNYMELSEKSVENVYSELYTKNGKVLQYAKNPLNILEAVGMKIDQIARVGAFDAAKQAGFSDLEAALVSRDVFDYSRGGTTTKKINTYVPFFRAAINGSDKLYRAFKERPTETAFWSLMTITLPSLALTSYYLYYAPDDERQEYKEIPENLRAVFWFYKEDGEWKRIPKPFQLGQIFGTIPEMAMLWMEDENRPEGSQMAATVITGLFEAASPVADWSSLLPIIVKVPAEWAANYNFFFGKNIYPTFLDGKDPAMRASPWNSETSKLIGETFNVSPALVENTLRGFIAGSEQYVTDAGDFVINKVREWNGEKVAEKPITPSDVMVIRALAQRRPSGYRSNSYQIFTERFDEVKMRRNTSKDLEGEKLQKYMDKHGKEINAYKAMNGFKKEISAIGKELRAVYESKDLTSEEKVERINNLEDQITNIAREGNKYYNSTVRN